MLCCLIHKIFILQHQSTFGCYTTFLKNKILNTKMFKKFSQTTHLKLKCDCFYLFLSNLSALFGLWQSYFLYVQMFFRAQVLLFSFSRNIVATFSSQIFFLALLVIGIRLRNCSYSSLRTMCALQLSSQHLAGKVVLFFNSENVPFFKYYFFQLCLYSFLWNMSAFWRKISKRVLQRENCFTFFQKISALICRLAFGLKFGIVFSFSTNKIFNILSKN